MRFLPRPQTITPVAPAPSRLLFPSVSALLLAAAMLVCLAVAGRAAAAPAPAGFDLRDTTGAPQRLADLKGKWVVVNFWATWCAPCVKEIPDIAAFAKEQGDRARVIGVALDWDDEKQVKAFAKKVGLDYPLVLANPASEKAFGKLKGLPTTIVYDPEGKVAYQKTGTVTRELLARIVRGEKA